MTDESEFVVVEEISIFQTPEAELLVVEQVRTEFFGIGIQGPRGVNGAGTTTVVKSAFQNLGGQRVVIARNAAQVDYADNQTPAHANVILGITENAAVAGAEILVKFLGEMTESGWNWAIGQPIFCGTNGLLTQTVPLTGFLVRVATAISPTTILVNVRQPILL